MDVATLTPLKRLRIAQGLSLGGVAKAVGTDKAHISRIERGLTKPRAEMLLRLSTLFQGAITWDEISYPELFLAHKKGPTTAATKKRVARAS